MAHKRQREDNDLPWGAAGMASSHSDEELRQVADSIRESFFNVRLPEELILDVVRRSRMLFMAEPMLVRVDAPITICGDIHGQMHDLNHIFKSLGAPSARNRYLFLGDYVDRGKFGIEAITLLLIHKILDPTSIILLRGNHESAVITRQYGFYDECKRKYSSKLWKVFTDMFMCIPAACLLADRALCMHGGISPDLHSLNNIDQIARPCDIPDEGLLCDLLWADPDIKSGWNPSERGVSHTFGPDVVHRLLRGLDLDIVIRAHQVVENGYEFFANRQLVTVFSATHYCGEYTNNGAALKMDAELRCSFAVFTPVFK